MNIRDISTARLKDYKNNPRNNDLAVEKIKYSIERFGFLFPVVIDVNYVIVCGHTRVRACRELGINTIPCIIADELTEEQINLFRLVDNKTSEYSDWDFEKLKHELSLVDLTLDKNQLLLDRFELTAEVFDLEPEQAEIKVSAFNFMGVNEKKTPKEKKPTVHTFNTDAENGYDGANGEEEYGDTGEEPLHRLPEAASEHIDSDKEHFTSEIKQSDDAESEHSEEPKKKESKAVLPFCQFRFGDVAFFISQVELDRLNEKYMEYIDSGAILAESFASYLLKGVENLD